MINNIFPSFRQLIWSIIVGLSSHPRIQSPNVFFPVLIGEENNEPTEIFIERWKTYDGIEVQSPNLTCAVFPYNQSSNSSSFADTSAVFEPYELGREGQRKAIYNFVIKLYFTGVAINNTIRVPYYIVRNNNNYSSPHGVNFFVSPDLNLKDGSELLKAHEKFHKNRSEYKSLIDKEIDIEINPAEEILREYIDILRTALDDLPFILPWKIKSSEVKAYDFPTTSWSQEDPNIFFHTAHVYWSVKLYVPSSSQLRTMIPIPDQNLVEQINLNISRSL